MGNIPLLSAPTEVSQLVSVINSLIVQVNAISAGAYSGGIAGGTNSAITLAIPNYAPSLGGFITFLPSLISVGPGTTTVSINGTTALPVRKISYIGFVDISDGDFYPGVPVILSFDGSQYIAVNSVYNGVYSAKSTGFTLSLADIFTSITTAGAFPITLQAASAYANFFACFIFASSGNITLVPNGTDQINGSNSNYTITNGSSVRLYTDGLSLWRVG